jgi:hypothetical protein
MPINLSDEQIAKKFGITVDDNFFEIAKQLTLNRPDRVICDIPNLTCPACGEEFTATYYDITADGAIKPNLEMNCPECENSIFVENIVIVDEFSPECTVTVILCTEPIQ